MKRLLSLALVAAALAVAAFFFLKMRRYLPERPRAAELAPAGTIFFAQFPNLRQTALRVPRTDLYQIWREPEVQAFLEKPRKNAPWMREWSERLEELARVAPGEAFVAVTALDGARASWIAGFSYAGRRGQAGSLVGHFREKILPGARRADVQKADGDAIERWTAPGGEMAACFHAHWCLFATSPELLRAALQRFEGKPDGALSADALFAKTVSPLGAGQDLLIYGLPRALGGRLDSLAGLAGPAPSGDAGSFAMATKIDGDKLRDTIFVPGGGPAVATSRRTLAIAPPQALFFSAMDAASFPAVPDSPRARSLVPALAGIEQALAAKGLAWGDLRAALGPEIGVVFDWPEESGLPTLVLAAEIRDRAKVDDFAAAIAGAGAPGAPWVSEQHDGVTVSTMPARGISLIRPSLAITGHFALLGLSPEAVAAALPRPGASTLAQSAAFQSAMLLVPSEAGAFGYLDLARAFERAYRTARPFITLSLAFSSELGAQFDAGRLPPVDTLAKHLEPTVFSQMRTAGGTLMGSVGSVTLPDLLLALGAAGLSGAAPGMEGLLPGGLKQAIAAPPAPRPAAPPPPPAPLPAQPAAPARPR